MGCRNGRCSGFLCTTVRNERRDSHTKGVLHQKIVVVNDRLYGKQNTLSNSFSEGQAQHTDKLCDRHVLEHPEQQMIVPKTGIYCLLQETQESILHAIHLITV